MKVHQHAIAQPLGIALAGFRKLHDLVCENFICQIAAVGEFKRDQSHLERKPMTRIVSESNLWPFKWGRIGMCISLTGGSATELSVIDARGVCR